MIENIFHKKELYGLIIRSEFRKKRGINFFTDDKATQQFGYMKHKKNYLIKLETHLMFQKIPKLVLSATLMI